MLGPRPEAIKLAPVIMAFQQAEDFRTRVVLTCQHREMVAQVMELFVLTDDRALALMASRPPHACNLRGSARPQGGLHAAPARSGAGAG